MKYVHCIVLIVCYSLCVVQAAQQPVSDVIELVGGSSPISGPSFLSEHPDFELDFFSAWGICLGSDSVSVINDEARRVAMPLGTAEVVLFHKCGRSNVRLGTVYVYGEFASVTVNIADDGTVTSHSFKRYISPRERLQGVKAWFARAILRRNADA